MKKCAIVLNAPKLNRAIEEDFIVCADGGIKHLKDRVADILIGDFDSLKSDLKSSAKYTVKFPSEKNSSDGDIALRWAIDNGFKDIAVYGITEGRQDHILCNLSLLTLAKELGATAVGKDDNLDIYLASKEFKLNGKSGDTVSLIPLFETAIVKKSVNLYYPLNNLELTPQNLSRGLSNLMTDDYFEIKIKKGSVFVFHYLQ